MPIEVLPTRTHVEVDMVLQEAAFSVAMTTYLQKLVTSQAYVAHVVPQR